jgi:hypothetical protein
VARSVGGIAGGLQPPTLRPEDMMAAAATPAEPVIVYTGPKKTGTDLIAGGFLTTTGSQQTQTHHSSQNHCNNLFHFHSNLPPSGSLLRETSLQFTLSNYCKIVDNYIPIKQNCQRTKQPTNGSYPQPFYLF